MGYFQTKVPFVNILFLILEIITPTRLDFTSINQILLQLSEMANFFFEIACLENLQNIRVKYNNLASALHSFGQLCR